MAKKAKFKVGDRVRIRKDSEYYLDDHSNPKDTTGTVTGYTTTNGSWTTEVDWDNNTKNSYRDHDLELETAAVKNNSDLTVDKEFVLQAHKSACSEWKKKIESKFPELFPKEKYTKLLSNERNIDDTRLYVKDNDGNFITINHGLSLVNGLAGMCGIPKEAKYRGIYINKENSSFDIIIKQTDVGTAILFEEKN